jgi:hypothetical protein
MTEPETPPPLPAHEVAGCFNVLLITAEVLLVLAGLALFGLASMLGPGPGEGGVVSQARANDIHWALTYGSIPLAAAALLELARWMFVRR